MSKYDTLIVITPRDFRRLAPNYKRLMAFMPEGKLLFVGSSEVEDLAMRLKLGDRVGFINEDDILPFRKVHAVMEKHTLPIRGGKDLPRGWTGWYYQQFLKMQYARMCRDDYYLMWDGDTIPCRKIQMFDETDGMPFMDLKKEFHREYFVTIEKLFSGMKRNSEYSFIAEHMLFRTDIMINMMKDIEDNERLKGESFWEKILLSIPPDRIEQSSFSEFETYGTYCSYRYADAYHQRRWHSFRLGAEFFDPETISDRDYEWLGKDFDAISFEKNQSVREDHKNLFDNPEYQKKLTAKQMLVVAQDAFEDGYLELWEEEDEDLKRVLEAMRKP